MLAIYVPWDSGGPQPTPQQFWNMIIPLCRDAPSQQSPVITIYYIHNIVVRFGSYLMFHKPTRWQHNWLNISRFTFLVL